MLKLPEAAARLGVSPEFLNNERRRGNIGFVKLGRLIFYTDDILSEYLNRCTHPPKNLARSASIGFPSDGVAANGAGHGTTVKLDRHDAHHLAQRIFKRPKSGSMTGSASTAT